MDSNVDLKIMSHVGHSRTSPEVVRGLWIEKSFFEGSLNSIKCHKCHTKCHACDIFSEKNGLWIMECFG